MPPAQVEQASGGAAGSPPAALRAAIFELYGDPGVSGKTTIFLRCFPRALALGRRDAIQTVAQSTSGFSLQPWQIIEGITTLPLLVWFLTDEKSGLKSKEWQTAIRTHGVNSILLDDASQIFAKSVILWRSEAPDDQFYAFKLLDQYLDWISFLFADLGLLCGFSAHKMEPKYDTNRKSRTYGKQLSIGGPEVPSSKQAQAVPGWATLVAPIRSGESLDPWWPRVIAVDPADAETWIAKDRNNVCWADTPANLREILRAAPTGYDLPRLPGLEWQDDVADTVAESLKAGHPVNDTIERIFAHYKDYAIPGTPGERHVQWACQDGIARYTIQRHKSLGVLGQLRALAPAAPPPPPPPAGSK